jgi:hypothetical protein
VHCCGLLFERDPSIGQFVVTGLIRGSEAAKLQFPMGSIISTVNDIPTHGRSESEFRKLLFSVGGDVLRIGATPPGWPSIIDVALSRACHFVSVSRDPDEFDNYCDGWSEKAFDEDHCAAKALHWLEKNPPHLAEHRFEHDQVPIIDDLDEVTFRFGANLSERLHIDEFSQVREVEPDDLTLRSMEKLQSLSWIQVKFMEPLS